MSQTGENLKKKTLKGTLWSAVERFGVQAVSFIVMIFMARVLSPEDYGLVGMLTIFTAVAQSLIDSGFSQGLIRKRDADKADTSTVFFFNIASAVVIYAILFFTAPLIARFYGIPLLIPLTRIISLGIIINSFAMVQRALFTIRIDFKTQAKASFSGAVIAGALGIWMVNNGWGVRSLVYYQLINYLINTAFLWIVSKWRPSPIFSRKSFRSLFSFGANIAISSIIDNIYRNIYILVIGKWFQASTLGLYTRAQQFGELPMNFSGIIQRVSFPVLCSFQDDKTKLSELCLKFINISSFVTFPIMAGMAAVANPMIVIILGEKWEFSATLLQILCFGLMWYPVTVINQNMLQVRGRSDLFLKIEIIKKIAGIGIICITLPFGLIPLCLGQLANSLMVIVINAIYTKRVIPLSLMDQIRSLAPIFICSITMAAAVWGIMALLPGNILKLTAGIPTGIVLYIILSRLFLKKDYAEVMAMIRHKS